MQQNKNMFTSTISEEQCKKLYNLLENRNWSFAEQAYAYWKASSENVNVVAYLSGKLVVQGKGTAEFLEFILMPEILNTWDILSNEEDDFTPHGGIDESGKGDFFGPLVVAGVYIDEVIGTDLRKLGVCDSKQIKSSKKIYELAKEIRVICGGKFVNLMVGPESYNRIYYQFRNLNSMLAWGHAKVIENLLEKVPTCPRMLSDKFAAERLIKEALQAKGRTIKLDQRTKAESDVAVAAASILAREQFLKWLERYKNEYNIDLPRGASSQVLSVGKELYNKYGEDVFKYCAKTHFKTLSVIKG